MNNENISVPVEMAKAWLESLESLASRSNGPNIHIYPNHPYSPIKYLRKAISAQEAKRQDPDSRGGV